jgi:methyltransferase family protein
LLLRRLGGLGRRADFTLRYRRNCWGDDETRSGAGSRRDSPAVKHSLEVLGRLTSLLDLKSIADIPCGDFNWIGAYLDRHPNVSYVGCDIVGDLIARNRRTYPGVQFVTLDIVSKVPPQVDLIFCKDLVNHLEDQEIIRAIENMRRSHSTWLLATSNVGYRNIRLRRKWHRNSRHVDLTAAPFRYPEPAWHDHYFSLWRLADIEPR